MHNWASEIRARLAHLSLSPAREAEIVEELSQHLDDAVRDASSRGVPPAEARAQALAELESGDVLERALRSVEQTVERDPVVLGAARGDGIVTGLWQDIRYAARKLRRTPGFTFVAVSTLAIAIGATTAVFSIVNGVLLRPLPFRNPGELVRVAATGRDGRPASMSYLDFADYRAQSKLVPAMSAYDEVTRNLTIANSAPQRLRGLRVSANYFDLIGAHAILGHVFTADDDKAGAAPVALISEGLWRTTFGGDPGITGRVVQLNGMPFTVVGVAPATVTYPSNIDIWVPLVPTDDDLNPTNRGAHYLRGMGRLAPHGSAESANAELSAIARQLASKFPVSNAEFGASITPLQESIVGSVHTALYVMLACVGFVLLIACANIANLLLVRAAARESEIAIRSAIGASQGQITRQLVTESVLLSLIGAAAGVLLARWTIAAVHSFGPASVPRLDEVTIDARVLAFTATVAILTGILFGLVPGIHARKANIGQMLRESTGGSSGRRGAQRTRSALVISEMSLAVVLLVGAGLLGRSFVHLIDVDPGYRPDHVVTMSVSLPPAKYPWDAEERAFANAVMSRLRALPGVDNAALAFGRPLSEDGMRTSFDVAGRPPAPPGKLTTADIRFVTPGFFGTLGMKITQGRDITESDRENSPQVIVVSQQFVKKYFPHESPLGKRITLGYGWQRSANKADTATAGGEIVGVVADMKALGADHDALETVYLPFAQTPVNEVSIMVRSTQPPDVILNLARARIREVDPDLPLYHVTTLTEAISGSVAGPRFYTVLLGAFAAIALVLAALGIYGVISYSVSQRTRELGIRIALGASRRGVMGLVVGQGIVLAGIGIAAGLAGAYWLTRYIATLLFGVGAVDALTFSAVAVVLLAVASLSSWLPARRASRVDPLIAMRAA